MCRPYHDQPEAAQAARESADHGAFEVVVSGPDGEALGTLNETFGNDFDASVAVQETEVPDVGISASICDVSGQSE